MLPKNITEEDVRNESALIFLRERTADLDVELMRKNVPVYVKLQQNLHNAPSTQLHPASSASPPRIRPHKVSDLFPEEIRPEMKKKIPPFIKNIQQSIEDLGQDLDALNTMISSRHEKEFTADKETRSKRHNNPSTARFEVPRDLSGYSVKRQNGNITCNGRVVEPLIDSSSLLVEGAENALYERFKSDGYLYFRELLDREDILRSKEKILGEMKKMSLVDENNLALSKTGWTLETKYGTVISGTSEFSNESDAREVEKWKKVGTNEEIETICNCNALRVVLRMLSSGKSSLDNCSNEPRTFDPNYTWIRIKAPGECTVNHADLFYFMDSTKMFSYPGTDCEYGNIESFDCEDKDDDTERMNISYLHCHRCSDEGRDEKLLLCDECNAPYHMDTCLDPPIDIAPKGLWFCPVCNRSRPVLGTCWIPLDDVPTDHGVLAVLSGSHYLPNFETKLKNSQTPKSFFTKSEFNRNLVWKTNKFSAGDCVFFDSKVIHCTSKNYEQTYRTSLDFRWYIEPTGRTNCLKTNQGKFVRTASRSFDLTRAEYLKFRDARSRRDLLRTNDSELGEKGEKKASKEPNNPFRNELKDKVSTEVDGHDLNQRTHRNIRYSSRDSCRHIIPLSTPFPGKRNRDITKILSESAVRNLSPASVFEARSFTTVCGTKRKRDHSQKQMYNLSCTKRQKHDKMAEVLSVSVKYFEYWRNITFLENKLHIDVINRNKGIKFNPDLRDFEFLYLLASLSERDI